MKFKFPKLKVPKNPHFTKALVTVVTAVAGAIVDELTKPLKKGK